MSAGITVSPRFVPCHDGDEMRSGWHVGRRLDWDDPGRFEVVWLDVQEDEDGFSLGVWRAGTSKPEHPYEWAFQVRIGGFRSMPAEPLELSATVH